MLKTYIARDKEIQNAQQWFVVDAEDMVLGRMASKIAHILKGKHKPIYSPNL